MRPTLGRGFTPEEGVGRNAHPVAVISHETWKNRYQGDPDIIGKTQYLNGVQHTIIGVAPENFHGTFVGVSFQFWVPISMQETFDPTGYKLEDRNARAFESFVVPETGRHATASARKSCPRCARRLEDDYPETNRGHEIQLLPLWRSPFNVAAEMLPTLEIAFAVVLFVLLIACANVSTLLLVRSLAAAAGNDHASCARRRPPPLVATASNRRPDSLGVRHCRWNRRRALVPECIGACVSGAGPGIIVNLPGQIDWRVLAVSAGVCVLATLLFALAPAIQASKVDLAGAINSGSSGVVGGRGRSRLRSAFVLIQMSLSFVLIAGAGLLMQSLQRIQSASPGFSTEGVLLSGVDLLSAGYNAERAKAFQDQLLESVRALPGVEAATFARVIPFGLRDFSSAPITVEGYQAEADERPTG